MIAERALLKENIRLLDQLGQVLHAISDEIYLYESSPAISSTAKHVRHIFNHYEALSRTVSGVIDYETRERGTAVETERSAALQCNAALVAALKKQSADLPQHRDLRIERMVRLDDGRLESVSYPSSLARELDFVHQHTVHHFAMIAVILRAQGIEIPADFGMSPSTLRFQAVSANPR